MYFHVCMATLGSQLNHTANGALKTWGDLERNSILVFIVTNISYCCKGIHTTQSRKLVFSNDFSHIVDRDIRELLIQICHFVYK
jgi:hypothetical protein